MKNLKKRLKSQGGFTLIEMLIVVAIIAILVAVSIPLVNSSLERARVATDAANERAAKAEATIDYLSENLTFSSGPVIKFYDADSGTLVDEGNANPPYGKCQYHNGGILKVEITEKGVVTVTWTGGDAATNPDKEHNGIAQEK